MPANIEAETIPEFGVLERAGLPVGHAIGSALPKPALSRAAAPRDDPVTIRMKQAERIAKKNRESRIRDINCPSSNNQNPQPYFENPTCPEIRPKISKISVGGEMMS